MALLDVSSAELSVLLSGLNALTTPPPPLPMVPEEQLTLREVRPKVMDALLRQMQIDERMRVVPCGGSRACSAHIVRNCPQVSG